jgi:acetoin utilization deacetylase AcuC-like enzyme
LTRLIGGYLVLAMLPIVHHPDYQVPLRAGHRFPMSKYGYLREALIDRGLLERGKYLSPAEASRGALELAHSADYVDRVLGKALHADEIRRIGLSCDDRVIRRTRLSAAGTTLAAWLALEHGIACNSAGGSHHAARGHGAGFCVFNDVAVAICNLRAQGVTGRFLVIDADVHQGDGTADIFGADDGVFTLSIHAEKNFPARKVPSTVDIGLADNLGDAAYLEVLAGAVQNALDAASPALVFYNAGVDVHASDKLGRLGLSDAGLRRRDAYVLDTVRSRGVPIVGVLGGGYGDDPGIIAERHAVLFEEAARVHA